MNSTFPKSSSPLVSFVLATHNRAGTVERTLVALHQLELPRDDFEIIVVDNASRDRTVSVARSRADVVLQLKQNRGSCAKAAGVQPARGRFIVFLDDDSYPMTGCVSRMMEYFEADPALGAAGFRVLLPDGREECSALPNVFVGCGVGFRAEALRDVGGIGPSFFMQAEEYDLSFRLAQAGWGVRVFDDLQVRHEKSPQARLPARTTYHDMRNNIRVADRYLPVTIRRAYRRDWIARYQWISMDRKSAAAARRGRAHGIALGTIERFTHRSSRLSIQQCEQFLRLTEIENRCRELAAQGVQRVLLADLGKNVYAFHRGLTRTGITAVAIADDRFAAPDRVYRGIPVLPYAKARILPVDAIIVSNTSYVHAAATAAKLVNCTDTPVHCWFGRPPLSRHHFDLSQSCRSADVSTFRESEASAP